MHVIFNQVFSTSSIALLTLKVRQRAFRGCAFRSHHCVMIIRIAEDKCAIANVWLRVDKKT